MTPEELAQHDARYADYLRERDAEPRYQAVIAAMADAQELVDAGIVPPPIEEPIYIPIGGSPLPREELSAMRRDDLERYAYEQAQSVAHLRARIKSLTTQAH
jgi:hypothetical protein